MKRGADPRAASSQRFVREPILWKRVAVLLAVLGTYTNFAVEVGVLLYGVVPLAVGVLLLLDHHRQAVARIDHAVALFIVVAVIDIGGAAFPEHASHLATATLQFFACLLAGTGLFLELRHWPRRLLERSCVVAVMLVLGFGVLESFTPFSQVSDAVRSFLYLREGQFIYDAEIRDVTLHGRVRPKIFTQEPSHPAKLVAIAITGWYLLTRRRHRLVIALAANVVAFLVLLSPTVLIASVLIVFFALVRRETNDSVKYAWAGGFFLLNATTVYWVGLLPGARAAAAAQGLDASTIIRIQGPLEIARRVLSDNPLFGLGIGGKEYASDTLLDVYSGFAAINMHRFLGAGEVAGWGSALYQLLACCGVLGTVLLLAWLVRYCRSLGFGMGSAVVMVLFVIFAAEGPFNVARPWIYFFLIGACAHARLRDDALVDALERGTASGDARELVRVSRDALEVVEMPREP